MAESGGRKKKTSSSSRPRKAADRNGSAALKTALRNAEIVRFRQQNPTMTVAAIGEHFGISGRQVQNIWATWRNENLEGLKEQLEVTAADPHGYIAEKIAEFERIRAELWHRALHAEQESVQIGAFRHIIELHGREVQLLQQTGLLPHDLGVIHHMLDNRYTAKVVSDIFERYVPKDRLLVARKDMLTALADGTARARAAAGV